MNAKANEIILFYLKKKKNFGQQVSVWFFFILYINETINKNTKEM